MADMKINTGLIRLSVNRDGEDVGYIAFNPNDVRFVENYYRVYQDCDGLLEDCQKRLSALEPGDYIGQFAIVHDAVETLEDMIDSVFGTGTSDVAFGEAESLEMFYDFFNAVMPHIRRSREQVAQRYLSADSGVMA